jgi:NTP pyrophosphatase (non-canonical NTP hydrolase)
LALMALDGFIILLSFIERDPLAKILLLNNMKDIQEVIAALVQFRDERDWKQFHNSKDLAIAINIESAELLEAFLWKQSEGADRNKIKEELADVFAFCFLLAEKEGLDVKQIVLEKVEQNRQKYPIKKAKGIAKKYNEL